MACDLLTRVCPTLPGIILALHGFLWLCTSIGLDCAQLA